MARTAQTRADYYPILPSRKNQLDTPSGVTIRHIALVVDHETLIVFGYVRLDDLIFGLVRGNKAVELCVASPKGVDENESPLVSDSNSETYGWFAVNTHTFTH